EDAEARQRLGDYLLARGKQRDALEQYEAAIALWAQLERPVPAGRLQLSIARVQRADGDEELALTTVQSAVKQLDMSSGEGNLPEAAEAHLMLGELLVAAERFEEARASVDKTLAIAEQLNLDRETTR